VKTIILAGGLGTRISEETSDKPKPMVLIDDKPILWHVMSIYALQGFTDFIVAGGYKFEVIVDWIAHLKTSWKIRLIETGDSNQTGSRIAQCVNAYPNESRFFVTYGDGLGNVNLHSLLKTHDRSKRLATVTAVRPPARFGVLESKDGCVIHFGEKNQADAGWINGGFFVIERSIKWLDTDPSHTFETDVLPHLVNSRELTSYHHEGFWQPMDTLRERNQLREFAMQKQPPWLDISIF
jgi:glucose-1-phosphate cytidylyltransferase